MKVKVAEIKALSSLSSILSLLRKYLVIRTEIPLNFILEEKDLPFLKGDLEGECKVIGYYRCKDGSVTGLFKIISGRFRNKKFIVRWR